MKRGSRGRQRGSIDQRPSGAYRVRVNAGVDKLTGQRLTLIEEAPTLAEAEQVRNRLLAQVDAKTSPRTKGTINQLLDRYFEVLDVDESTRRGYEAYTRNHIRPVLGALKASDLEAEQLDRFYAQLRRCRQRCRGRGLVDHRTKRPHDCDDRCRPHQCRPLAPATIRQIHWILSGAMERAVRWRWVSVNPVAAAGSPVVPPPSPRPPSPEEAGRILQAAWNEDETWGTFVWLVMATGGRRGELLAVRRSYIDLDRGVLTIPRSISEHGRREKDTKTHQQRRVALDELTGDVLREHLARLDQVAAQLGASAPADPFLFSYSPTGNEPMSPSGVTHRYARMVQRLGLATTLHKLRHYNATELIAAGVDVRTVAGRLGHSGGGHTTLRVYAAWVSEADQRAASAIGAHMARPDRQRPPK